MPSDPQPLPANSAPAIVSSPRLAVGRTLSWSLLLGVYGGWALLSYYAGALPWWLVLVAGGYIVCLHGSLQHEAVHGHLTGHERGDAALVTLPLVLWIPYGRYRALHRAHHQCPELTDPLDDPESYYWTPRQWQATGRAVRALAWANQTLAGRLVLGPWLAIGAFWRNEAALILAGDRAVMSAWGTHLLAAIPVLLWVSVVCGMPLWQYLLLFVWPGTALTLMRSFTEHRPLHTPDHRSALVEGSALSRLLYLNNNLHLLHHRYPELPWYRLGALYRSDPRGWRQCNDGFYFRGYREIARRYLFRPKDSPVHPQA